LPATPAPATSSIQLAFGAAGVLLEIADDGCGFDAGAGRPDSFGLAIMRERASQIGAELQVDSAPGAGTRITAIATGRKQVSSVAGEGYVYHWRRPLNAAKI
jgi:nitrate/nitrite-specific signal transduction histidine kinase